MKTITSYGSDVMASAITAPDVFGDLPNLARLQTETRDIWLG